MTSKSTLLRSCLTITWISLTIYLCFWPLMHILTSLGRGIRISDKVLVAQCTLDGCLSLCAIWLSTLGWWQSFSWTAFGLLHACLIVEGGWIDLVNSFDIQVLDVVRCSNHLSIVVFFATLVRQNVFIHQEVNLVINRYVLVLACAHACTAASLVAISNLQNIFTRSTRRLRLLFAVQLACSIRIN